VGKGIPHGWGLRPASLPTQRQLAHTPVLRWPHERQKP